MNKESLARAKELDSSAEDTNLNLKRALAYSNDQYNDDVLLRKESLLNYFDATDSDWNDYEWQLENRISDIETLSDIFKLSSERYEEISKFKNKYRWAITPYYISLLDANNPADELGLMAVPCILELSDEHKGESDPMSEEFTNPAGAVTRRYPDRLIINFTNACGMYCRFCQRKRNIGETDSIQSQEVIDESIAYIRDNKNIREVLITGGDPFTLSDSQLESCIKAVREIPHVQIIRIGTRAPATFPQRITQKLVDMLKKYHPLYVNVHFNHPKELTADAKLACNMLADAGIPLGNQMVLLKGVNDDKHVVMELNRDLLSMRVKPYYIFQAKKVQGATHFCCKLKDGMEIIDYLIGNTSGMAKPYFIVNAKGGRGKVPLLNPKFEYLGNGEYKLTTWENMVFDYSDH